MAGLSALMQICTPLVSGTEAAHMYEVKMLENGGKTLVMLWLNVMAQC